VYAPAAVPPGSTNVALAAPAATAADVTGTPMVTPPWLTVNFTVPAFTAPPALVTVAESATFWLLPLNAAAALLAVVVVAAAPTVKLAVLLTGPAGVWVVVTPEVVLG
jgi:hypothetical protein